MILKKNQVYCLFIIKKKRLEPVFGIKPAKKCKTVVFNVHRLR